MPAYVAYTLCYNTTAGLAAPQCGNCSLACRVVGGSYVVALSGRNMLLFGGNAALSSVVATDVAELESEA